MRRSRLSRGAGGSKKHRLASVPKYLGEYKLIKQAQGKYYFYQEPVNGNAVEIAEITLARDGKNFWVVKTLAQTVRVSAKAPAHYIIINQGIFPDKGAAFRNWKEAAWSDEQVPEAELRKLMKVKTYKVKVERNEYRDGKVVAKEISTINVYAKNPVQARKHGVESVSGGQRIIDVREIPYEQAEAEGEIY